METIDADLLAELSARWLRARVMFGDLYSAICRPGSWEFQLPIAEELRELLHQCGYTATTDPEASWRLRWHPTKGANQ